MEQQRRAGFHKTDQQLICLMPRTHARSGSQPPHGAHAGVHELQEMPRTRTLRVSSDVRSAPKSALHKSTWTSRRLVP